MNYSGNPNLEFLRRAVKGAKHEQFAPLELAVARDQGRRARKPKAPKRKRGR